MRLVFVLLVISCLIASLTCRKSIKKWNFTRPPPAKHGHNQRLLQNAEQRFKMWDPKSDTNIWEFSGLYEGDIMLYTNDIRNGILNETYHWPNATVPFFIDEDDFSDEEITTILKGIQEYHNRTCIRFRPYKESDKNWIIFKGNSTGCWSSVGMQREGQVVNLNTPKCVKHGVVLHELLHALGFYHQQSATERDEYVKINWENILDGHEFNFKKYNESHITNYGVEYDYGSVMHYSEKAFSKNGMRTIEALKGNIKLGQRKELSGKDVTKLNKMYEKTCNVGPVEPDDYDLLDRLIELFENAILDLID